MVLPVGRSRRREVKKQVLIVLRKTLFWACTAVNKQRGIPALVMLYLSLIGHLVHLPSNRTYGLSTHALGLLMGAKIAIEFFYPIR